MDQSHVRVEQEKVEERGEGQGRSREVSLGVERRKEADVQVLAKQEVARTQSNVD